MEASEFLTKCEQMAKQMPGAELGRETRDAVKLLQMLADVVDYFKIKNGGLVMTPDARRNREKTLENAFETAFDIVTDSIRANATPECVGKWIL